MAQMSNYLENAIGNHVFRNIAYASPTTVYMALYSSTQTEDDLGTELVGDGYARIPITFGAPSDGTFLNDAEALFAAATATWLPVVSVDIKDASTGGNSLMYKAVTSTTIASGNQFRTPIGDFTLIFQ